MIRFYQTKSCLSLRLKPYLHSLLRMSSEQSAREVVEDGRSRDDCGETDDVERIFSKLAQLPSYVQYPILMERCRPIVQLWHDTFSESEPKIWKKMKRGIPKELNEISFILDEMINMCNASSKEGITIIDVQWFWIPVNVFIPSFTITESW